MRRLLTLSLLTLLAVPAIARATSAAVDVSSVQPRITNLHSTTSTVSGGETEMAAWSESDHTGIAWRSLTGRWTPARALPPGLVDIGDYSDDAFMAVFQNGTQIKAMNGSRQFDGGLNTIGHAAPGTSPVLAVDPDEGSAIVAWRAPAANGRRVVEAAIRRADHLFSKAQTLVSGGNITAVAVGNSLFGAAVAYVRDRRLFIRIRSHGHWRAAVELGAAGGTTSSDIQVGFDDLSDRNTVVAWRHDGGILDVAGAAPVSRGFMRYRLARSGVTGLALAGDSDDADEWELAYSAHVAGGTVVRELTLLPAPGKVQSFPSPGSVSGLAVRRGEAGDIVGWTVAGSPARGFVAKADSSLAATAVAPSEDVLALQPFAGDDLGIGAVWIAHTAAGDVVRSADAVVSLPLG